MKSTLGLLRPRNAAPVTYVPRRSVIGALTHARGASAQEAQMRAMGAVGTLFAVVNRTSTETAAVEWHMHRRVSDRSAVCELCEAHGERVPGVVLVEGHVALDILNDPNDFYTGQELREAGQQHLDLTGEAWLVIERDPRVRSMPIGLWVVRPDRMRPVPSPTRFIAGYEYVTPDGETVPLALDDVIFIRMPNPLDPYRGMGPVQALLADLDSVRYSAEWNRNFFVNSAEPGGIIEAPRQLSDREFNDFITRWREQHQGVAQAHRVALLENMKWVERKYTMRDMQFAELRGVSREVIREAFALHKHKLGLSDDVNRANAEAADADFQAGLIVPRLKRWRGKLNQRFLPLFGETARDLELAFCSPVPEDRDAANAERTSKATAVKTYIEAKVPLRYALEQAGLPELSDEDLAEIEAEREREEQRREEQRRLQQERFVRPAPGEPAPGREPDGESIEDRITRLLDERERAGRALADWLAPERPPVASLPRNAKDLDPDELPDISHVQEAWERALAALLADWADVTAEQIDRLVDAVRDAISAGDIERLAALPADSERGAVVLAGAMESLARSAAEQVVDEAREQGVEMEPGVLAAGAMTAPASVTASLLAIELAVSAGRQALRLVTPAATPDDVAAAVREHLEGLTDARPRLWLGGALTEAQHRGRDASFRSGPVAAFYGNEQLDSNTCRPCRQVHGKWLGNTVDDTLRLYPLGGYRDCLGGVRCRGQVVAIWRGGDDPSQFIEKEPV